MKTGAVANAADPTVLSGVLSYLNTREFPRMAGKQLSAANTLFARHDRICASYASFELDSLFQPVFDLRRRRVIGHEALLASVSTRGVTMLGNVLSPERVFTLAANEDITFVDRLARTLHALNYLLQGANGLLHLNVHPHHLLAISADHGRVFEGILKQCGLDTRNIVLEIPEHAVPEKKRLAQAVQAWQEKGYRIAIDNFGREQMQISRVRKLKPAFLKIDRERLQIAVNDRRSRQLLLKAVKAAQDDNVFTIAVGVETHAQLDVVKELDIDAVQGHLFGKPQPYCLLS